MIPLRIPNPYTALIALVIMFAILGSCVLVGYRWGHRNGLDGGYNKAKSESATLSQNYEACVADRNDYDQAFSVCSESTGNLQRAIDGLQAQHAINAANAEKLRGKVIAIDAESARDRVDLEARNRALMDACAKDPECGEVLR